MRTHYYSWGSICDYKTVRAEPVEALMVVRQAHHERYRFIVL